jgi:hypothetical protein
MHRQITHAVISGVKRPGLALLDQQRAPGGEGIFVPVHDGHTVLCQDDRQNIPLGVRVLKQFVARWPNKERRIQVGARNSPHRTGLLNADSPSSKSSTAGAALLLSSIPTLIKRLSLLPPLRRKRKSDSAGYPRLVRVNVAGPTATDPKSVRSDCVHGAIGALDAACDLDA